MTVHDGKAAETRDLGAQFYLGPEDVGQNRAEACRDKLQELNTSVEVVASAADLTQEFLRQFNVGAGRGGRGVGRVVHHHQGPGRRASAQGMPGLVA